MNDFLVNKLKKNNLTRKNKPISLAMYKPLISTENLIFISGQLPLKNNKIPYTGKIDCDLTNKQIYESINIVTSNLLWVLNDFVAPHKKKIKSIKCLNIKGYLNTSENFSKHPQILNYTSELIIKVLGKEDGEHTRSVIGVNSLPLNSPIEIDGIFSFYY